MKDKLSNPKFLAQLALLVAVELVMKITGLGSVPIGPIYMSLPVAIGAILMGPLAGAILGGVFGIASFIDAISGASAMGGVLFQVAPFKTFVLCVITRILMGFLAGVVFKIVNKIFRGHTIAYSIGSISAPLLNTLFFMGFLVIAFYDTDYIQKLAHTIGATNPLTFVITLVGLQGLIEAVTCCILGTVVSKALANHLARKMS